MSLRLLYLLPTQNFLVPRSLPVALLGIFPKRDSARLIGRSVFERRVPVSVPDGCLLVQAGKQLERLTGGHVLAGFHEVCCRDLHKRYTVKRIAIQSVLVLTCLMWVSNP